MSTYLLYVGRRGDPNGCQAQCESLAAARWMADRWTRQGFALRAGLATMRIVNPRSGRILPLKAE